VTEPTQNWTYDPSAGTIKDGKGLCLDAVSGVAEADGDKVVSYTCYGGPHQKWQWDTQAGAIKSSSGRCLDLNAGSAAVLWTCYGGAHQKWMSSRAVTPAVPPPVSFSASPTSGTAPLTTTFTIPFPGNTTFYLDYGDNSVYTACSASQDGYNTAACNPGTLTHTYSSPGTYTANLHKHIGGPSGPDQLVGTVTITVTPPPTATNVGACTYKGTTYAEGQSVTVPMSNSYPPRVWTLTCDNAAWVFANIVPPTQPGSRVGQGVNVCDVTGDYPLDFTRAAFACSGSPTTKALLSVIPRHGKAPLTVTAVSGPSFNSTYTLSWGDGTIESLPHVPYGDSHNARDTSSHTYAAPGSYTISYSPDDPNIHAPNSATIRVDAP
jgi:PKD repeat protein